MQEEAQRDKTSTVKGTSSPEFKEQFKLNINRNHRGFRRVVQSKGVKFEIVHKGYKKINKYTTALGQHMQIRPFILMNDAVIHVC